MKVNIKLLEEEMDKKHVSVSELARMSNVDKSTKNLRTNIKPLV